jgi:hypothetical protein
MELCRIRDCCSKLSHKLLTTNYKADPRRTSNAGSGSDISVLLAWGCGMALEHSLEL